MLNLKITKTDKAIIIHDENDKAFLSLEKLPDNINYAATHTYVDEQLRGQGIAVMLYKKMIEIAKQDKFKIKPVCSFVVAKSKNDQENKELFI